MSPESVALKDLPQWVDAHGDLFSEPNLILLSGEMGAGKTTMVSAVVRWLGGSKEGVSSPTFALHHQYKTPKITVDHMDLYRLENDQDLESSGFFEVVSDGNHLCFLEWSNRIDESFYQSQRSKVYVIELKKGAKEDVREIRVRPLFETKT